MLIYKATNKINGKIYVGYTTKKLTDRILEHIYKSRSNSGSHYFYIFKQALRKYGENSFIWEELYECKTIEECCEKEKFYIKELNTISPNGYNLTEGGNGGTPSNETKEKISQSLKKYWAENKNSYYNSEITKEQRTEWANKSWITKRENGYEPLQGFKRTESSNLKLSNTKNEKNKIDWINDITGEEISLSCTLMAKHTNLSISTFNHIKRGRSIKTKCGWRLKEN